MKYKEFIENINNGNLLKICFFVKDYNHYHNCSISRRLDKFSLMGREIELDLIEVKLTNDKSERVSFLNTFKEDCKLFTIKRKRYTLKEIWDKIEITEIVTNKGVTD